jgi:hypothetical protein
VHRQVIDWLRREALRELAAKEFVDFSVFSRGS